MLRLATLFGLAGLAVATALIVWSGWAEVAQALEQAGLFGILATSLFHWVPIIVSSAGWQILLPAKRRPSLPMFVYFMWIRASVNNLMPVARIGGEIAAVRVMTAHGMRRTIAIAATVVELTLSVAAVFLFVSAGVFFFALRIGDANLVSRLVWGLALALPVIIALALVQKIGFFGLLMRLFRLMFRDKWATITGNAAQLDRAVSATYRRRGRVVSCGMLQLVAWSLGSVEIWLALHFLGRSLPWGDAFIFEALIQGSASAAFAVPGALGVQEAGFLFFGGMLGLPPTIAAALAVMRRCRDLICYAPGLVAWQMHEGKKLLKR